MLVLSIDDERNLRLQAARQSHVLTCMLSEFRLRILMHGPASSFVISNAVRDAWLSRAVSTLCRRAESGIKSMTPPVQGRRAQNTGFWHGPSGAEDSHCAAPASLTGNLYCNIFQ
jgi:hypothetical protein